MCVFLYVYLSVCLSVCLTVCMHVNIYACTHVLVYAWYVAMLWRVVLCMLRDMQVRKSMRVAWAVYGMLVVDAYIDACRNATVEARVIMYVMLCIVMIRRVMFGCMHNLGALSWSTNVHKHHTFKHLQHLSHLETWWVVSSMGQLPKCTPASL